MIWKISISVSAMILVMLFFRKVLGKRVSKGTIMVFWNLILIRAFLPCQIQLETLPIFQEYLKKFTLSNMLIKNKSFGSISQEISVNAMHQAQNGKGGFEVQDDLLWIWAVGVLCFLIRLTYLYVKESRMLRRSVPVHNPWIERMVRRRSFFRKIRLYESSAFETPVTYGVLFPRIILPMDLDLVSRLDMRNMIAHELEHIRKFDVGKRYLMSLALCLHWFNPLVWIMYRLYQEDQEIACDERVMRRMKEEEASSYIYTLIKMASEKRNLFSTTAFGSSNTGKRRIIEAMGRRRKGLGNMAITLCLSISLLPAFVSLSSTEMPTENARAEGSSNTGVEAQRMEEQGQEPELIEPRYDGFTSIPAYDEGFDYDGVMKDIIENYNDVTQKLTEDQAKAIRIQEGVGLAEEYKEKKERGEKLTANEIWFIEEYGDLN